MSFSLQPLAHISAVPPYPPGRPIAAVAREFGLDPERIVKLASNENPLGPPPKAVEMMKALSGQVNIYPDFDAYDLKAALAKRLGVSADEVLPAAGSSELINIVAQAFLCAGRKAVVPQYSFVAYEGGVRAAGAQSIIIPARSDWTTDVDAMLAAMNKDTHVAFLTTPANPLGAITSPADIERLFVEAPEHVVIVLDEAYREFVAPELQPDFHKLRALRPNALILRTFSKVYALAGLRVGYGVGSPELLSLLRRLQIPFSVNSSAQAVALSALEDEEYLSLSVRANAKERAFLCLNLDEAGVTYLTSHANFVLIKVGDGQAVAQALMRRGLITRPVANYGLPEWLRVTVGLRAENELFLRHLKQILAERR